jgi:integrase
MTPQAPRGKRCGCRDPETGKQLGNACPKLRQRHHGFYEAAPRVDTSQGHRKLHRSGFSTAAERDEFVERVRELVRLAEGDAGARERIGDLLFAVTRYGGQLPSAADVRLRLALGRDLGTNMTTGEWLETWHAGKRKLRESTARVYRGHLDNFLIPELGHIQLDRLSAAHISAMFDRIGEWNAEIARARAEGRPPVLAGDVRSRPVVTGTATQHRIYATLRNALAAAVRQRQIPWNPCAGVELAAETREPARVYGPDQVASFLRHAERTGDRLVLLYRLVLLRGLRRGEACGLQWADLDLSAGEMRIRRTILQFGGKVTGGQPKTRAGERTVSLDAATVALLKAHRRRQASERLAAFGAYKDHNLVFAREDGSPVPPDYVSKHFAALTRAAGLPRITLHQGRHTAASLALEAGLDIKIVSEQMGHSTTRITQDLYQHVRRSVAGEAAERVAGLLAADDGGRPGQ